MKKLISLLLLTSVILTTSGCISGPRYVYERPMPPPPRVVYYYPYYDPWPRYYVAPAYPIITWSIGVGIGHGHGHGHGPRR